IRKPCLIGPPSMLYPAMRAARVDDNVRHALKALGVGLDFGRNFLAGLRASNHKNAHLTLASPRPRKSVKVPPREKWSKLLTLKIYSDLWSVRCTRMGKRVHSLVINELIRFL